MLSHFVQEAWIYYKQTQESFKSKSSKRLIGQIVTKTHQCFRNLLERQVSTSVHQHHNLSPAGTRITK